MTTSALRNWQSALDGNGWKIEEAPSFEAGVAACGGHQVVEEVIAPIKLGCCRNPMFFPPTRVPGVRIAKTKVRFNGPEIIMGHSVLFRVDRDRRTVVLLHVELTNPDPWIEDDFDPFA